MCWFRLIWFLSLCLITSKLFSSHPPLYQIRKICKEFLEFRVWDFGFGIWGFFPEEGCLSSLFYILINVPLLDPVFPLFVTLITAGYTALS